ncbi:MAG: hypothetical protein IIT94_13020, partial [Prevotella sp.]|nr:hypothetical protein [Prevotella sp.]
LVKEPRPGVGLSLYNAKIPAFRLGFALQDGLEPEYMKPTEIIRNYKKLNTNKLHKRIER